MFVFGFKKTSGTFFIVITQVFCQILFCAVVRYLSNAGSIVCLWCNRLPPEMQVYHERKKESTAF